MLWCWDPPCGDRGLSLLLFLSLLLSSSAGLGVVELPHEAGGIVFCPKWLASLLLHLSDLPRFLVSGEHFWDVGGSDSLPV